MLISKFTSSDVNEHSSEEYTWASLPAFQAWISSSPKSSSESILRLSISL